jgi:hypothetical protein
MKFAKRVFLIAGIYGLIVLLPLYFMEDRVGRDFPPAITHAEYYYGFAGAAAAWQVLLLFISTDPIRYRPMMIPPMLAKTSFFLAVAVLYLQQRASGTVLGYSMVDLALAILFLVAYIRTPEMNKAR